MIPRDDREILWAVRLTWAHALLFGVIAIACYVTPETAFGDTAWLPLARFAVFLFAAALAALALILIASALAGERQQIALALLAAVVLDVQVPILAFSQPAALEYLHTRVGIPWFVIPVVFLAMVGLSVHCLLRLKRNAATNYAGASN